MRLGAWRSPVGAIKILAGIDVGDAFFGIDEMGEFHQRQGVECTIKKSCVSLAPLVAIEGAAFGILQRSNVLRRELDACHHRCRQGAELLTVADSESSSRYVTIKVLQSIQSCQDLYGTGGVENVSIVSRRGTKASTVMETRQDEIDNTLSRQGVRAAQKVGGSQAPVQAIQS